MTFWTWVQKNSNYGDVTSYLKVEKIDGDNITISKITPPHNHIINQLYVEELYKKDKDSLERFTISRAQIKKAFNVEREPYSVDEVPLKINYGNYYVRDIETFFSTNIKLSGADSWGPEVKVGLVNTGHPGELSDIKVIDGDVDITSPASKHLYAAPRERNGYNFDIAGKSSSPFGDFKISFTVTDSLGHRQVYQIGGSFRYNRDYNERTIERISQ